MLVTINRYIRQSHNADPPKHCLPSAIDPEFKMIRSYWFDSSTEESFTNWLTANNITHEYKCVQSSKTHQVMKIIFKSEQEYLAFKLRHYG